MHLPVEFGTTMIARKGRLPRVNEQMTIVVGFRVEFFLANGTREFCGRFRKSSLMLGNHVISIEVTANSSEKQKGEKKKY